MHVRGFLRRMLFLKMTTMMMIVMLSCVCFRLCFVQNGMVPFVLEPSGLTCHSPTSLTRAPWVLKLHVKFHKRRCEDSSNNEWFHMRFSGTRFSYFYYTHKIKSRNNVLNVLAVLKYWIYCITQGNLMSMLVYNQTTLKSIILFLNKMTCS